MGVNIATVLRFLRGSDHEPSWSRSRAGSRSGVILASTDEILTLVHRPNLTVRDVCVEAATKVDISPLALDFFTLVSEDHRHYLNPNKVLTKADCNSKYHFKLCFKACSASVLWDFDHNAYNYYFHQCRNDFLEGRVQFGSDHKKKECLLKLIILEIVYVAKKKKVPPSSVLSNPKTYGIRSLLNREFLQEYSRKEVRVYICEKMSAFDLEEDRIKVEYLHTIEQTNGFFVHTMTVEKLYQSSAGRQKETTATKFELYISPQSGIKKKKKGQDEDYPEEIVKEFEEVISLDIDPNTNNKVTIYRSDARPEILYTESAEDAQSLVTLIAGYYRLLVNQYKNLTRVTCREMMGRTTLHGPIDRKHAVDLLDQEGREDGLYLIRKKRETHGAYALSVCYQLEAKNYDIVCQDGKIGFKTESPQLFDDLQSLVAYHTHSKGGLPVCLKRQCQPKLEGFDALLAERQQPPVPLTPRPNRPARFYEVSFEELQIRETLDAGEFGLVTRALRKSTDMEHVSVTLRTLTKPSLELEEEFYGTAKKLVGLLNQHVIQVHGVSTTSDTLYLVTEYAERGHLDHFILEESQHDKGILKARVLSYAVQIADGMLYLHTMDIAHGRLSAHNVLVMDEDFVKISDAGLHQLVDKAGKCDTPSGQRTTSGYGYCWYSPLSLQSNTFDQANDIWSFGVTLWELFAMKRPFHRKAPRQPLSKEEVMRFYLKQQYLDPNRPNCPQRVAQLIKKCWLPRPEERISFKEIVIELMSTAAESPTSESDDGVLLPPDGKFLEAWEEADSEAPVTQIDLEPRTEVNDFGQVVETEYSCLAAEKLPEEDDNSSCYTHETILTTLLKDLPTILQSTKRMSVSRIMSCPDESQTSREQTRSNPNLPRCYSCPPNVGGKAWHSRTSKTGCPVDTVTFQSNAPCVIPIDFTNGETQDEYVILQRTQSQQNVLGPCVLSCAQTRDNNQAGVPSGVEQSDISCEHRVDEEEPRYVASPLVRHREVKPISDDLLFHIEGHVPPNGHDEGDLYSTEGASFSGSSAEDEAMMSLSHLHLEHITTIGTEQPVITEGQPPSPVMNLTNGLPDTTSNLPFMTSPATDHPYVNQPSDLVVHRDDSPRTVAANSTKSGQCQLTLYNLSHNGNPHSGQGQSTFQDSTTHGLHQSEEYQSPFHNSVQNGQQLSGQHQAAANSSYQNGQHYSDDYEENGRHLSVQQETIFLSSTQNVKHHPVSNERPIDRPKTENDFEHSIGDADKAMLFLSGLTGGLQDVPGLPGTDEVSERWMATEDKDSEPAFSSDIDSEEEEEEQAETATGRTADYFLASLLDGRSNEETCMLSTIHGVPLSPDVKQDLPEIKSNLDETQGYKQQTPSYESKGIVQPEQMDRRQEPSSESLDGDRKLVAWGVEMVSAGEQVSSCTPPLNSGITEVPEQTADTPGSCTPFVGGGMETSTLSEEDIMSRLSLDIRSHVDARPVSPDQNPDHLNQRCEIFVDNSGTSDPIQAMFTKVPRHEGAPCASDQDANPDKMLFNPVIEFMGHSDTKDNELQPLDSFDAPWPTHPSLSSNTAKGDEGGTASEAVELLSDDCTTCEDPSKLTNEGYHHSTFPGVPSSPNIPLPSCFPVLPIEQKAKLVEVQRKISNLNMPSNMVYAPVPEKSHYQLNPDDIPENLKIKYSNLRFGKVLGWGNFGEVRHGTIVTCKNRIEKREDVAVKVLKKTAQEIDRENFQKEAKNMIKVAAGVDNNYIIRLRGISYDEDNNQELMLITELAPKGSLESYLRNDEHKEHLNTGQLLEFSIQIAKGMAYLAGKNLVHRDLATRNVLVAREDLVKISDFGLSRLYSYYKSKGPSKVPTKWYPLESLLQGKFTSKSDVWSFGVTMWEMFSYGKKPYADLAGPELVPYLKEGNRLPQPDGCPDKIYKVMERCWEKDYQHRPTFFILHSTILGELQNEFPN